MKKEALNYGHKFDYVRLEKDVGKKKKVREVHKKMISNKPHVVQKWYWNNYIYLWINYALYKELEVKDNNRMRVVFNACFGIILHVKFTFIKVWILTAWFEIWWTDFKAAQVVMENAIGRAPKKKLFKKYNEMEWAQLTFQVNVHRYWILYGKYIEWSSSNCCL